MVSLCLTFAWRLICSLGYRVHIFTKPGQISHCDVRLTYDHFWVDVDWKSECFPEYLGHGFGGCLQCIQMRATGLPLSRAEKQQPVCRVTGLVTISILFSWLITIKVLCKKGGPISAQNQGLCVSCCWQCPGTSKPRAAHLTVSLFLCSSESNTQGKSRVRDKTKELLGGTEEKSVS